MLLVSDESFIGDNMKHILILLILCGTFHSFGEEIKVSKMSPDGDMDRSFVLRTNLPDTVVLDCQSFIQGLRIGDKEDAIIYIMDSQDCESMLLRVEGSLKKSLFHCIDVEEDIRSDYSCS
jgi:hypothetical protein